MSNCISSAQVLLQLSQLAGISMEEAEKYKWLCTNAVEELTEMLKDNTDLSACGGRLTATATAMAYYNYCVVMQGSNVNSVKIGDISVNCNADKKFANDYLQQCLKSIAPYLKDSSFMFKGVKAYGVQGN
ncbi:MAG: hypothetical protein UH241_08995 [Acutalibacteraceae bacterium]|nr:hypothetical protein [Acutalibacteraceae bacterium]